MPGRDQRGRFLKGHSVKSPGRPPLAAELPMTEGIRAACTAEDVARVLEKLRDLALKGHVQAAALYLSYAVGKPGDSAVEQRLALLESLVTGLTVAGAK